MAVKQSIKSKSRKQSQRDEIRDLIRRFLAVANQASSAARKLELARLRAERKNPTVKSLVKKIEVLNASPGDLIILTAKSAPIDKLQAILEKYAPAFTARGLEVMITDGSCDIRLAKKQ